MTIDGNITTSAIATAIACAATAILTYRIFRKNYNASEIRRLDDSLNQIIAFSIQYPYLEDTAFIAEWSNNKNSSNEKFLRYEMYCILNFNFLDRLCIFYEFNKKKIENFVHVKEIIRTHAEWWKNPTGEYDNVEGYSKEFREFINSYLK